MHPRKLRSAFTLVELLIVITIIAILVALTVASIGYLRRMAYDLDTKNRLNQLDTALQTYQAGDNQAYLIQTFAMGDDKRFANIGTILEYMRRDLAIDLTNAANLYKHPPDVWSRTFAPNFWGIISSYTTTAPSYQRYSKIFSYTNPTTVIDFRLENLIMWGARMAPAVGSGTTTNYSWFDYGANGENLNLTMDLMPNRSWPNYTDDTFLAKWPMLTQATPGVWGPGASNIWPASDWMAANPVPIPPVWAWPWGERILDRYSIAPVDFVEPHNLSELSPLYTIKLMQQAGKLPLGAAGVTAYRSDRSGRRDWNDRWGNPMIMSVAAFLPLRYGHQDRATVKPICAPAASGSWASVDATKTSWACYWNNAAFAALEQSGDLMGPRDLLLRRTKENYGFNRAIYITCGAVGPYIRDVLPTPWTTTANDNLALKNIWLQISDTCRASDWTETSFKNPPKNWSGVRILDKLVSGKKERCYLTIPNTIR